MKSIITTILLLTFWLSSFGQKISVDTLSVPGGRKFPNDQNEMLRFPLVKTGDPQLDKAINTDLKNRFTNNEYPELSTYAKIMKWADEQIAYLNFDVTYIKNGLISLNITAEGCGAYCTVWTDYYTYNYRTGQFLTLDQVIDTTGSFNARVVADKDRQYERQKKELKEMLLDSNADLDEDTYKWALEHYNECDSAFTLRSFALHRDHLEIIERCYLPNAIKNLTPTIVLKYEYTDIEKDLKIKN